MHAMPCCVLVEAVTAGANCCTVCHLLSMDQLRSQVKQEDVKVKEGWSTHAVCCVCVWAHPLGHLTGSKHMSQTDAAKGFGGKFGVLKDRQDKVGTIQRWGQ